MRSGMALLTCDAGMRSGESKRCLRMIERCAAPLVRVVALRAVLGKPRCHVIWVIGVCERVSMTVKTGRYRTRETPTNMTGRATHGHVRTG